LLSCRASVMSSLRVQPLMEQRRFKKDKPVPDENLYPLTQAIAKAKTESPERAFREGFDLAMFLNIDPRKADHQIRTLTVLPHGTGKSIKICVFATDAAADQAREAGAHVVGGEELVNEIKDGRLDFDRTIATPAMMPKLNKVARILGPRGMMPNNKLGTVTDNVADKVRELMGAVTLRADKVGNVHALVGKRSFTEEQLVANISAIVTKVAEHRPAGVKEPYVKSCSVSTSMGPSFKVVPSDLLAYATVDGNAAKKTTVNENTNSAIRFVNPEEWDSVDLSRLRSKKLKKYLVARRAAMGLPTGQPDEPETFAARARLRHVNNKRTRAAAAAAAEAAGDAPAGSSMAAGAA